MSDLMFDSATAVKIKRHYQEEYTKTLVKLNDLKSVLEKLAHVDASSDAVQIDLVGGSTSEVSETPSKAKKKEPAKPKRSYTKKRGRKSIWGKFIKSRLRATQTPLSYDDMTYHAIAIKNLEPGDFEKTRQKIVAAAFNLRNKQDVIDTYAIKGSRTKYMGFKDWFEREGLLKQEFIDKIKQ
jgi:hypothetical protein